MTKKGPSSTDDACTVEVFLCSDVTAQKVGQLSWAKHGFIHNLLTTEVIFELDFSCSIQGGFKGGLQREA